MLTFHHATGAVVAAVLEHLGHSVHCSRAPHEENFEGLRQARQMRAYASHRTGPARWLEPING